MGKVAKWAGRWFIVSLDLIYYTSFLFQLMGCNKNDQYPPNPL